MNRIETADQVFEELNDRRIGIGPDSWVAQVFGVYMASEDVWVQVAAKDNPSETVILHMPPSTTTSQGALALWKWAQTPNTRRGRRVDATCARTH